MRMGNVFCCEEYLTLDCILLSPSRSRLLKSDAILKHLRAPFMPKPDNYNHAIMPFHLVRVAV